MESLQNQIREDSKLPQHIQSFGQIPKVSKCNAILLTGVTGNLGPYLLRSLLEKEHFKIYCLVRKTSLQLAQNILSDIKSYVEKPNRVILLAGDLRFEKFGIDSEEYEDLSHEVDAIIHSAVKSNHLEMYQKRTDKDTDLRTVNVLGTLKIMEFATTGKMKCIFYASSILGCNRVSSTENVLSEELIEEDNYGDGLGMGYAVSKFICDKLMSEAIRRGIPCIVCRFPLIIFDSQTGIMDLKSNHYFYLLKSFSETGMKPEYPAAAPIVPVDNCAKIAIDLFFNEDAPDGIYNLMNPHKMDMQTIVENISKMKLSLWEKVDFITYSKALATQGEKSILYPFRKLYFDEDAELMLAELNLVTKLLLTNKGSQFLQNVSSKFRKYNPCIDDLVEHPQELIFKMVSMARVLGQI